MTQVAEQPVQLDQLVQEEVESLLKRMRIEMGREPTEKDREWAERLVLGLIVGDRKVLKDLEADLYADET